MPPSLGNPSLRISARDDRTSLPVSTTERAAQFAASRALPDRQPPRVLITGAAGVVASALARNLSVDHSLIGLDLAPVRDRDNWDETHTLSVADREAVHDLVSDVDYVLHLAHGALSGWEGLRAVDIDGTRNVLDGAIKARCCRVVLASSNHVRGWSELDSLAGIPTALPVLPSDPPRPDGLYGVAKTTMEALGRAAAEYAGLPVSVLRIGTCRLDDDLEHAVHERGFSYIGDEHAVRSRLRRTWLSHTDLFRIIREEFAAHEAFRLRYAISSKDETLWSIQPLLWSIPDGGDHAEVENAH